MTGPPGFGTPSRWSRALAGLRPSHAHLALSATVSSLIRLVRTKYIPCHFGSGTEADAINAVFVLPDVISYFLVGGAASITFVTILTHYRDTKRETQGQRSLSVILTTMWQVLNGAGLIAEDCEDFWSDPARRWAASRSAALHLG